MTIVERFKQARTEERTNWARFSLLVNNYAPYVDPLIMADNIKAATGKEFYELSVLQLIKLIKEEV